MTAIRQLLPCSAARPRARGRVSQAAALAAAVLLSAPLTAQSMDFEAYDPESTLVVPEHPVTAARYPFVDVHNHIWGMPDADLDQLVADMDALNMAVMVNLSGRGWNSGPDYLQRSLDAAARYPGRFLIFTNISFEGIDEPGWGAATADQVEADIEAGCVGLKIYKNLGLTAVDAAGGRIAVDDPRIGPVWDRCGALGVPVLIHSGEPASFWEPRDEHNERWLELKQKPERYRDPALVPAWEQVMGEQWSLFRRHPQTTFIDAHMGWMANDLGRLGALLDELPNVYTEIGAVLAELGRQPRAAAAFLERYQDRVFFGKDAWEPSEYHCYFRVLETEDEYFDYYRRRHAFWKMYGLGLPDRVLRKLYFENALKLFPSIERSRFEVADARLEVLPPQAGQPGHTRLLAERCGPLDGVSAEQLETWEGWLLDAYFDGLGADGVRRTVAGRLVSTAALQRLAELDVVAATPAYLNVVAGRDMADSWDVAHVGRLVSEWTQRVGGLPRFVFDSNGGDDSPLSVAKRVAVLEQWHDWWADKSSSSERVAAYRDKLESRRDG